MEPSASRTWMLGLLLALVAVSVYAVNLSDYFIGDDFDLIRSFHGKPLTYFFGLLYHNESGDVWKSWGIDENQGLGFLRPLKIWLLALDLAVWGPNPTGFHATSALFFVGLVVTAFRVLSRLLPGRPTLAFAGGLAVAIHPVFSEIAPFITAREDILAAWLGLWAFQRFLRLREIGGSGIPFCGLFALALLTKESAIAVALLVAGHDLVHGRLWPRSRVELREIVRFYGPLAAILAVYFGLRWLAFGNFKGGDAFPTGYGSIHVFLWFHRMFFRSIFDSTMFFGGGGRWPPVLVCGIALAALGGLALRGRALGARYWRDLLFFGPLWYLGTTIALYGTFFAVRRNGLPLLGILLFAALIAEGWIRLLSPRLERPLAGVGLLASVVLFLPPTIENSLEIHRASEVVRRVRSSIDDQTRDLPEGSRVLLLGVPQWEVFPYYFGWGLQSALSLPFTSSDLARVSTVIEPENLRLNAYKGDVPREFDRVIELPDDFLTEGTADRWRHRLIRDGVLRPDRPGL